MAMLNDDQIRKFQELHRNRFRSEISREGAIDQGSKLINLMSLIMQAMAARQDQEMAAKGNPETKDQ